MKENWRCVLEMSSSRRGVSAKIEVNMLCGIFCRLRGQGKEGQTTRREIVGSEVERSS